MNRIRRLLAGGLLLVTVAAVSARAAQGQAEEKEGFIPGIELARPSGGFLGLELVNYSWVLSFYDDQKQPASVDVTRAILTWPVKYQPNPERVVLNPKGANTLASAYNVRPPRIFSVTVMLFVEGNTDAVETHTVFFNEETVAADTAARKAAWEAAQ